MPAEFLAVKPGDVDSEPARFRSRRVPACLSSPENKSAWNFAELIQPRDQPGLRRQWRCQDYRCAAERSDVCTERGINLFHRRRQLICLAIAIDGRLQVVNSDHNFRDTAEILGC